MRIATGRRLRAGAGSVLAALGLVAALAGCGDGAAPAAAPSTPAYPSSMDALGASTTRGYNDCPTAWTDCPDNSWSTGRNAAINSIYLRLLALNPRLMNKNFNDAVSGSTMADLQAQAHSAVRRKVQLVTIAMGTNDACGGRAGAMTPVSAFRADFTKAMDTLTSGLPEASIRVVSIPDVYQIWQLFHSDPNAVTAWTSSHFCDTLLANPTSGAQADSDRRGAVRARVIDFNTVLAEVCAKYPQCTTDGGAIFKASIAKEHISTNDYWHPSIAGQSLTARLVWGALGY
jgi:lysophospholipase L1-like esterase